MLQSSTNATKGDQRCWQQRFGKCTSPGSAVIQVKVLCVTTCLRLATVICICTQHTECHCRSIKDFVKQYQQRNDPLDILVNNASIFIGKDDMTEDGMEV